MYISMQNYHAAPMLLYDQTIVAKPSYMLCIMSPNNRQVSDLVKYCIHAHMYTMSPRNLCLQKWSSTRKSCQLDGEVKGVVELEAVKYRQFTSWRINKSNHNSHERRFCLCIILRFFRLEFGLNLTSTLNSECTLNQNKSSTLGHI